MSNIARCLVSNARDTLRITALSQERPDGDATAEGKTTIIVGSDFVQKFIC